jgi:hypothetical protein
MLMKDLITASLPERPSFQSRYFTYHRQPDEAVERPSTRSAAPAFRLLSPTPPLPKAGCHRVDASTPPVAVLRQGNANQLVRARASRWILRQPHHGPVPSGRLRHRTPNDRERPGDDGYESANLRHRARIGSPDSRSVFVEPGGYHGGDQSGVAVLYPLPIGNSLFNAAHQQESSASKGDRRQHPGITQAPNYGHRATEPAGSRYHGHGAVGYVAHTASLAHDTR